jgi:hypothetical protein
MWSITACLSSCLQKEKTSQFHVFVSSSETGVRNGIKSWKAYLVSSAELQEAIGGLYFSNK